MVALVALAAAGVVTYFEARNWWVTPKKRVFETRVLMNFHENGVVAVRFSFRVAGASPMHEVSVHRVDKRGAVQLGDSIFELSARDGLMHRDTAVLASDSPFFLVMHWQNAGRYGVGTGAMRFRVDGEQVRVERWVLHRWPWGRATDGKWRVRELRRPSGARGVLEMVESRDDFASKA